MKMLLIWIPHFESHCLGAVSQTQHCGHFMPHNSLLCGASLWIFKMLTSIPALDHWDASTKYFRHCQKSLKGHATMDWEALAPLCSSVPCLEKKSPVISNLGGRGPWGSWHLVRTFCLIPLFLFLPFISTTALSIFNCKSVQREISSRGGNGSGSWWGNLRSNWPSHKLSTYPPVRSFILRFSFLKSLPSLEFESFSGSAELSNFLSYKLTVPFSPIC